MKDVKNDIEIMFNNKLFTKMAKKNVYGVTPKVKKTEVQKVEQYDFCFNLVTRGEKTQIAVGNVIVSGQEFESVEAAKKYIDSKPWGLIVATTGAAYDIMHNVKY